MSVFKDFPGLENLEKNLRTQGLSRIRKSPAVLKVGDERFNLLCWPVVLHSSQSLSTVEELVYRQL